MGQLEHYSWSSFGNITQYIFCYQRRLKSISLRKYQWAAAEMNEALGFTEKTKQIFHNFSADKNYSRTILYIKIMSLHNVYPPPLSTFIY